MTRGLRIIICVLVGVAISAALAYVQTRGDHTPLQTITGMPIGDDFAGLVDQNEKPVTPQSFAGKYQLVFFGFTHCPAICPTELTRLAAVLKKLSSDEQKKVKVIFVSLDPTRDTPKIMKSYVETFDPAIAGLTGSEAATKKVVDDWKVYAAKVPLEGVDYTIDHSAFLYFRGPNGALISLFQPEDKPDLIASAVKAAMAASNP